MFMSYGTDIGSMVQEVQEVQIRPIRLIRLIRLIRGREEGPILWRTALQAPERW